MHTARLIHTATLLNNGKVLVAGGQDASFSATASAELFDPVTGTWKAIGSMTTPRVGHTATLLPDGRVLVAGGEVPPGKATSSAEIYDPRTETWRLTENMKTSRASHFAILITSGLLSGNVLVGGGYKNSGGEDELDIAELFNPSTGQWVNTGRLKLARYLGSSSSITLPNGSIMIAGGSICCPYQWLNEAEVYNPVSQTWTPTKSKTTPANGAAILLPDGKVLVAGGSAGTQPDAVGVANAELFEPATGTWTATASMSTDRESHTVTLLPNGQVLAAGGYSGGWGICNDLGNAELYNPGTGTWSSTGNMTAARRIHKATLLPNGQVLVTGGLDCQGNVFSSAELYTPVNETPTLKLTTPYNIVKYSAPANIRFLATPAKGSQIKKVQFYQGTTLLHTETLAPYGFTWKQVPVGEYTITAKATDQQGQIITSTPITITVVKENVAPFVRLQNPAKFTSYPNPATIRLVARAKDPNDKIKQVAFYQGETLLHTAYESPYSFTWRNVAPGTYTLTAKATDAKGLSATSAPVKVKVNLAPTVTITSPAKNTTYSSPASITLNALAADADGTIRNVQFYQGTTFLKTISKSPYSYTLTNVKAGNYSFTAKATDNNGAESLSATVSVTVMGQNKAPSVSIISPASNTSYTEPATITINALAADEDGRISNVKFYVGTTYLKTISKSPYTYTLQEVTAGTYSLTAKATDNEGAETISAALIVKVAPSLARFLSRQSLMVDNQPEILGLTLAPNPVSSILQIQTPEGETAKPTTIIILSASGRVLKTMQTTDSNQVIPLDVSSLASGVYTIQVISGDKVWNKRFVKL